MPGKVNRYRYKCSTENKNIFEWRDDSEGPPTECKNDSSHTIVSSSIAIIQAKEDNKVIIQEENIETGGHFQTKQFHMSCAANSWTELDLVWEYPISLLDAEFITIENMRDDELEVVISPNTIVGGITAAVVATDTVISVQQSVIDNSSIGFGCNITDLTNMDSLGYIIAIDKVNLTVTVSIAATQSFSPLTPTYFRICPKMARDYILGHAGRYTIGQGKIGGSYLPTGTIVRIRYHNKHASTVKDFYAELDYLY